MTDIERGQAIAVQLRKLNEACELLCRRTPLPIAELLCEVANCLGRMITISDRSWDYAPGRADAGARPPK